MTPGIHRVKYLIASRRTLVVSGLVLIGVVALSGAAWAYTHPPSDQVTEQTHVQTIAADTHTSAVVTKNTSLWEPGTRLESKTIYPTAAPNLTVTLHTTIPSGHSVHIDQQLTLIYRASREDSVFWQREDPITRTNVTTATGTVTSTATLRIPAIRNELERIGGDITGLGTATVGIRVTVRYETNRYDGELSTTAPLEITHTGYWLTEPLSVSATRSEPVTRQITNPPDPRVYIPLTGLGVVALLGAGVVWVLGAYFLEPTSAYHELNKSRYGEWISEGRVDRPISAQRISMASLSDLVDVAIDSHQRVVYDPDRDVYAVVDHNAFYYFDPDEPVGHQFADGDFKYGSQSGGTSSSPGSDEEKLHGERAWEELIEPDD